ncbi:putative oxidoreductase [Rhizobium sp. PP-F2F-G48]|uniref:DoxX family protein n=1 Tax=Rhizobium sp. PP-F2F-G48 TaxID=2135651 RepID=UPI001049814C|nr:DoxX family protein [Rhizobium sp. PP-F2F-G48]TCM56236.1 putative oxidoreductase [Rhizobium sp. PP-F2F-G48]
MSSSAIVLVGRILLSIIFILAGFGKISNLEGTAGYFAGSGLPVPMVTAVVVSLVELIGGIFILVGFLTRPTAYVLAAFCIATAFIAHFNFADMNQMINFQKNFAMAGGFLVLAAFGPGALSVDARRA